MNVIFTCGGTGGHINPAIAVANIWKARHPESKILFIGGKGGMEEQLVKKAGYDLVTLPAAGIDRGKSLQAIKKNVRSVYNALTAVTACRKIIRKFGPSVIVGTGGYASFPALMAGSMMGIPTCVHESNAMPGLTTRMLADRVDRVLVCFPQSAQHYKHPDKVEVVGMPVRQEFIDTKKEDARKELGLDNRPVILSTFGSLGAKVMNEVTADMMALERDAGYPYQHIHAVGSFGWEWMPDRVRGHGIDPENTPAITLKEYIYNMPTVMAAADIIISRAGASSCNEIAASGTPCILIPSPNVTDNHQEKNARALAEKGGAAVLLEKDCTPQTLLAQVRQLLEDKDRYEAMGKAQRQMVVLDSAQRLCGIMEELAHRKEK